MASSTDTEELKRRNEALRRRNEQLLRRAASAEQALAAFARGEVDAVALEKGATPLLLGAAQDSLRRSEQLLRSIFEGSLDAMLLADDTGAYVDANPAACTLFGLTREQLQGRRMSEFAAPGYDGYATYRAFGEHGHMRGQFPLLRPDGGRRTLEFSAVANVVLGLHLSVLRDVSEQVAAEHELHASRDLLEEAQAIAHVGSWRSGIGSDTATVCSRECYRIFGAPEGAAMTVGSFLEYVPENDRARLQGAIDDAAAGRAPFDIVHRIVRPDATVHWVHERGLVERDAAGNATGMVGTTQDVTDHHLAVEALRTSEGRLRVLHDLAEAMRTAVDPLHALPAAMRALGGHLRASRCVFATVDADGEHCHILEAYTDGRAAMLGRHALSDLGPRLADGLFPGGAPLVRRDRGADLLPEPAAAAGAADIVAFVCAPLSTQGSLRALIAVHQSMPRDWTPGEISLVQEVGERCWAAIERTASEAKLLENESLLRLAGRAARLGGWSVSLPAVEVSWSEEVCTIHGVPAGTRPSVEAAVAYYAPEFRPIMQDKFDACARDGTPFDLELQIVTAAERRVWVRAIGHAERSASGAICGLRGAFQDIDDRRKLQDQLRQSQKMEAVGRLAGGVAHDFNNLLSVILSYAEIAIDDLKPGDPLRNDIVEIREAGQRATALTSQLLAFSRQQVLAPRVVDLGEVIEAMKPMLGRLLGEDVDLSVLSRGAGSRVLVDRSQIEQVVMNLAVNARHAMPDGGSLTIETSNVTIDAAKLGRPVELAPGPFVVLTVTDSGAGMTDSTRTRVFEPFFTTKEKGTGLGLATVFGIVQQSGGHASVRSELGHGTSFELYFPRTDEVAQASLGEAPATGWDGSETILLVEDEEQVRNVACAILRKHGYKVLDTCNGGEAFLASSDFAATIHLLLTDVVMPRMSGRRLAEQLAQQRPEMKVLYASGYTDDAVIRHGVESSSVAFLQKPFTPRALLQKVREVLDAGRDSSAGEAPGRG